MNTLQRNLKNLARRNKWFLGGVIGVYVIAYTARALAREFWRARKKLAACLIVFSLCSSKLFMAVAYAEAAAPGSNAPTTETGGNVDETTSDGSEAGGNVDGTTPDGSETGENVDETTPDGNEAGGNVDGTTPGESTGGSEDGTTPDGSGGKEDETTPDGSETGKNPGETSGGNGSETNPGGSEDGKNPDGSTGGSEDGTNPDGSGSEGNVDGTNPGGSETGGKEDGTTPGGSEIGKNPGGTSGGNGSGTNPDGNEDGKNPGESTGGSEDGKNPGGDQSGENKEPGDASVSESNPSENPDGDESGKMPGENKGEKPGDSSVSGSNPSEAPDGDGSGKTPGENKGEKPGDSSVSGNNPSEAPDGDGSGKTPGENENGNNPDETQKPGDASVSDNDPDEEQMEEDASVSGNDVLPEEESTNYIPLLAITYHLSDGPSGILIGNASSTVGLATAPSYIAPGEDGEPGVSPAVCVWAGMAGETRRIDLAETGMADIAFPEDFYGAISLTAEDEMGNTYAEVTPALLIDTGAPSAALTETLSENGERQVRAVFREDGYTATGIAGVRLFIDGVETGTDGYQPENIVENCFGQGVISGASMPIVAEQAGRHVITLEVWDRAGNSSSYTEEVDLPQRRGPILVSVTAGALLTIAPGETGDQIYSDDFTFENQSGYDIFATLDYAKLTVARDGLPKDCSLFLSGEVFEDIALPEGESEKLLSVRIPAKKKDGTNGTLTMRLHGTISEGSEMLWKNGDLKLELRFDYEAAE